MALDATKVNVFGEIYNVNDDHKVVNYNNVKNTPIIKCDLSSITPQVNTYYQHIGTTGTYIHGALYFYNGSAYKIIDGSSYDDTGMEAKLATKQDKLTAGSGISIDENNKISADLTINGSDYNGSAAVLNDTLILNDEVVESYDDTQLRELINTKQNKLVSGTNIKTINGATLLGSGNITIESGSNETYNDTEIRELINTKQDKLTVGSGINIDSNNKISVELTVNSSDYNGSATVANNVLMLNDEASEPYDDTELKGLINNKQDKLVSSKNIKTVNGQSLLGSGNITIEGGGGGDTYNDTEIRELIDTKQDKLTAGYGISIDSNSKISANLTINSSNYNGSATVINEVLMLNDETSGGGTSYDDSELRTLISNKVDKENGKGLSSNDYTTDEKNKVALIKTDAGASSFLAGDGSYKEFQGSGSSSMAVDQSLSATSTSPISNSAVTKEINTINTTLNGKQDKLTAGNGITIDNNNKISANVTVNSSDYNGSATVANEVLILNDEANGSDIDLSGYATKKDLTQKVDKVDGKDLSTNDFTDSLKTKLENISITVKNNTLKIIL